MMFTIRVNGTPQSVDVDADTPLLCVLRDFLGLTGEYVTQVSAIGPLGLEYMNPADDPRNHNK